MSSRHRTTGVLVAALWALSACTNFPITAKPATTGPRKPATTRATATATDRPAVSPLKTPLGVTRAIPAAGPVVTLTGKVKLISDHGGGIISSNGAGIISNNSGGIISSNGAGLISDSGGGLTGKTKRQLLQGQETSEFLLADADIIVQDAGGRTLVGPDGKPVTARTDGQGGYTLSARMPAENLVLRIKLWNGGELSAILAKGDAATRDVAIDTAATLGATYVLSKYVKGDQKTFDKLPAAEADRLRRDLDAARGLIGKAPVYEPDKLIALTDELRAKAPSVDKTLADIEVLLVGGLGDGKPADQVAINQPYALAMAADGTLYIGENSFGRVRTVSPDGLLTTLMDGTGGKIAYNVPDLMDMALLADGSMYLTSDGGKRVTYVPTSGQPVEVAGGGTVAPSATAVSAKTLEIAPHSVAAAADGSVYIGEEINSRILLYTPDGLAKTIGLPDWGLSGQCAGLLLEADGSLLVLRHRDNDGSLWRRSPAGAWTQLAGGLEVGTGDIAKAPDGAIYFVEEDGQRVQKVAPDGTLSIVAGRGVAGSPDLVTPCAVAVAPDGTLFVADRRANLVHARKPDGTWRIAAGAAGVKGNDGFLALNGPTGVTFDADGHLIVAESTGHGVSRFDGKALTPLAGGVKGDEGDGGPALAARFDTPAAVVYKDGELVVLDGRNFRIRAVGKDGIVRSLTGYKGCENGPPLQAGEVRDARAYGLKGGSCMAIGPDGLLYWSAAGGHQIARLRADGKVEHVAGHPVLEGEKPNDIGDGGPAKDAGLMAPLSIAFDKNGDLFVADTGNLRIRKITGLAGGEAKIEAFAGLPRDEALGKLFSLEPGWERAEEGKPARDAMMIGPAALVFDAAGNLYFTESGTANVASLTFSGDSIATNSGLDFKLLPPVPPRLRKIAPDGTLTAVGGPGAPLFDPTGPDALGLPTGLAIDGQGRLVITDVRENALRFVPKGGY